MFPKAVVAVSWTSKLRFGARALSDALSLTGRIQGVRQIKQTDLNPVYLFLSPPSLSALRSRLAGRGTDSEAAVTKRLATALKEIDYAKQPSVHDLVIINDDLDRAYALFEKVALGEKVESDVLPPLDD
jgi:guanylate kinase